MVAERPYSISVNGDGNVVAGRDVNLGSTVVSIEEMPSQYRAELLALEKVMSSSAPLEMKREKVQKFARDLSVAGFGAVAKAVVTHLLVMI